MDARQFIRDAIRFIGVPAVAYSAPFMAADTMFAIKKITRADFITASLCNPVKYALTN
jgi:hypothetical protein